MCFVFSFHFSFKHSKASESSDGRTCTEHQAGFVLHIQHRPRLCSNYKNENFVRIMKKMSRSVDKRTMPARVAEHFLLNAGMIWRALAEGVVVPGLDADV
jgi:hypothetical protein